MVQETYFIDPDLLVLNSVTLQESEEEGARNTTKVYLSCSLWFIVTC